MAGVVIDKSKTTRLDISGVTLLLFGFVFCFAGLSRFQTNSEDVVQWLPDNSPSRAVYDAFEQKFGSDDFLIVTWEL